MKKRMCIPLFTIFLVFFIVNTSYGQINFPPFFEPEDDPLEKLLNSDNSDYRIRSGTFMGTGSGGAELMFQQKEKPVFGSLYFGVMGNPENKIADASQMRFGGFMIGVERPIYNGSQIGVDSGIIQFEHEGMRAYYRLGAGINFNIVERYNLATGEQSLKLHPGIQTSGMVGVTTPVSKKLSMFMEIGGMLTWNQGIPQMRWWGRPYLSVGVYTGSFW